MQIQVHIGRLRAGAETGDERCGGGEGLEELEGPDGAADQVDLCGERS